MNTMPAAYRRDEFATRLRSENLPARRLFDDRAPWRGEGRGDARWGSLFIGRQLPRTPGCKRRSFADRAKIPKFRAGAEPLAET